ncbi:MAG TPA: hypothetical protein VF591_12225 [Pyrinomonadaceae bacterium]|jgi:hypothetical protein
MLGRIGWVGLIISLLAAGASARAEPELKVWIIPAENAGPNEMARGEDIRARVEAFNASLKDSGVTVLNTVDPELSMKLLSWNPAFAVPNASVVLGQRRTLRALQNFAAHRHVRVVVRFITWDEAFGLLSELDPSRRSAAYPDVVQIGSTWVGYLAERDMLLSRPDWEKDRANWQPAAGVPASVLPYITDVRLLFYWKRLPSAGPRSPELALNGSSWGSVVDSIRDGGSAGDTLALPTGLTLNILHDYAPLVWAGPADFVADGWLGSRVDLTSPRALAVPTLLMNNSLIEPRAGEPRRLIAFPESSHEEVSRIFVNGGYRAILEPANFVGRWRQDFGRRSLLELLKQSGITADDDFVAGLTAACRERARGATDEEIARFVMSKAPEARAAKEPNGFLLSAVPQCFDPRGPAEDRCRPPAGGFNGRRFWDYAGVAVPPVVFKGGSDLVVFKGTADTKAAFALADFLATDPEFTSVLAEAGHLPAGRPGYGIDVLVGTMSGGEVGAEAQQFARSVQKAIDQGRSYPQLAAWPTAIENKQVLEALQNVWRRMGERDSGRLREAASRAEWAINARLHTGYWLADRILQAWQVIAIILLVASAVIVALAVRSIRDSKAAVRAQRRELEAQAAAVRAQEESVRREAELIEVERRNVREEEKRVRAERNLVLLLNLLRAHRHDAAKYLGDNLEELADEAEFYGWEAAAVVGQVRKLSELFEQALVPHIDDIYRNQFEELQGVPARLALSEVVDKAYRGATYIFQAKNRTPPPYVHFARDCLSRWYLETLPHAAVVILEEWFLNCLKHFQGYKIEAPDISVEVVGGSILCIRSSGTIGEREAEVLRQAHEDAPVVDGKHEGLPLIRNILHYAYGVAASVAAAGDEVELRIPLPLRPAVPA